ncbi:hypothetical protein MWH30_13595 [Fuchsiella alkaliacetigena]|nr:hypothetical protein [Fuchsiella alkaliacetigena]
MENRLSLAKNLLSEDGVLVVAIDENEQEKLGLLLESMFPDYEKTCVTVVHNPGGIQGQNFSYTHEYAYFVFPNNGQYIGKYERDDANKVPLRDWGGEESKREHSANCFYPIYVKNNKIIDFGDVCAEDFHPEDDNIKNEDGTITIYPIDDNGVERKWRHARQSVEEIRDELKCEEINDKKVIMRYKSRFRYKTVWLNKKYNSNVYGSKLLNNILGSKEFDFPKSIYNVYECLHATTQNDHKANIVDFFAGSGTTAHATLKLNEEDDGERKYILVEMGNYFDKVTKKRIQKLMYSKEWKDGKPQSQEGYSHIFRYQILEQYEDTLDNIEFEGEQMTLTSQLDDYLLNYMLDYETQKSLLDIEKFEDPFNYELKIREDKEQKRKKVNLIETFNYLIGLHIKQFDIYESQNRKYKVVTGKRENEEIIVIWRKVIDLNLEEDKRFIEEEIIANNDFDKIYINGDNYVTDSLLIEDQFDKLLFSN